MTGLVVSVPGRGKAAVGSRGPCVTIGAARRSG
jgi:hypothetical protein